MDMWRAARVASWMKGVDQAVCREPSGELSDGTIDMTQSV